MTWASRWSRWSGPVSLLLALAASGLNGQNFAFVGYLPQDAAQRAQRISELEALALQDRPDPVVHRDALPQRGAVDSLLKTLQPTTRLAVASGLTLPEAVYPQPAGQGLEAAGGAGRRTTRPAVFAIGR